MKVPPKPDQGKLDELGTDCMLALAQDPVVIRLWNTQHDF